MRYFLVLFTLKVAYNLIIVLLGFCMGTNAYYACIEASQLFGMCLSR